VTSKFPLAASALVLFLAATPYFLNAVATPKGQSFDGAVCLPYDRNVYVALIEQGQRGVFLLTDPFTTEPHRTFLRPLWSLVGIASRPFGLSASGAYLVSSIVLAAAFLFALWRFLGLLPLARNTRRLAFLLVPLGSGVGWLLSPERIESLRRVYQIVAPDRMDVESSVFLSLLAYPQAAATMGLLLALLACVSTGRSIAAAVAALAIGFIHPHDLVTLAGALGVWLALEWRAESDMRLTANACLAPAIAAIIALAYHASGYASDAVYRETFGVATLSPHPFSYVIAFLPALLLAPFGVSWALQAGPLPRMLVAWAIAVPFLLYVPIPTQRRVIVGYAIPLYILAAAGLPHALQAVRRFLPALSPTNLWPRAATLFVCLAIPGNLAMLALLSQEPISSPAQYRSDAATHDALVWFAAHGGPRATLLGSFLTGNRAPGICGARVVAGHSPGTLRLEEKLAAVRTFFDSMTPAANRSEILARYSVTHVLFGPAEKNALDAPFGAARATYNPADFPGAAIVFQKGGVSLVDVRGRGQ